MNDMDETTLAWIRQYFREVAAFTERVMVFIEGGYLNAGLRDQFGARDIDLTKFSLCLAEGRRLMRTYYYTATIENPPDDYWRREQSKQQRFLAALAYQPNMEVRLGRLQFGDGGIPRQKRVDVLLALDLHRFALKGNYDTAILVAGDADFSDIVRMVKDEGRRVEIYTFPGTRARSLLEATDKSLEITEGLLKICWMANRV